MTLCVFVQNRCSPSSCFSRNQQSRPRAPFSPFCSLWVPLCCPLLDDSAFTPEGSESVSVSVRFSGQFQRTPQLKPSPAPLGLCVHRIGSVIPLPSGPRPIPGHQPMFCSIRFPRFESGIGGTPSPTTPMRMKHFSKVFIFLVTWHVTDFPTPPHKRCPYSCQDTSDTILYVSPKRFVSYICYILCIYLLLLWGFE